MKNLKSLAALLLCLLTVLSLVACGDKPAETTAVDTTTAAETTATVTTTKAPVTTAAPVAHTEHVWSKKLNYYAFDEKGEDGSIGYMAYKCSVPGCKVVKEDEVSLVYVKMDFDTAPDASYVPSEAVEAIEATDKYKGFSADKQASYDAFLRYIDDAENVAPYTGLPGKDNTTSTAGLRGVIKKGELNVTTDQIITVDKLALLSKECPLRDVYVEFDVVLGSSTTTSCATLASRPINNIPNRYTISMYTGAATGDYAGMIEVRFNEKGITKIKTESGEELKSFDACAPIGVYVNPSDSNHVIYHIVEDHYTVNFNGVDVCTYELPERLSTADTEFLFRWNSAAAAKRTFDNFMIYAAPCQLPAWAK